jgi:hypothetical protein
LNPERTFLLVPQRFDGIEIGGFLGGIKTEKNTDGDIGVCQRPAFIWKDPGLSGRLLGISH